MIHMHYFLLSLIIGGWGPLCYSPNCREQLFSETRLPDLATLSNRTGGKPISSLYPGRIGHASCYGIG
jgi:hypothetical protein